MLWCLTYTTLFFCHVSLYEQEGKGKGNPGWRVVFGTNRSNQISVLLLIYPVHREVSLKYDSPEKRTQHKKRRARFMCAGCEWWWYGEVEIHLVSCCSNYCNLQKGSPCLQLQLANASSQLAFPPVQGAIGRRCWQTTTHLPRGLCLASAATLRFRGERTVRSICELFLWNVSVTNILLAHLQVIHMQIIFITI